MNIPYINDPGWNIATDPDPARVTHTGPLPNNGPDSALSVSRPAPAPERTSSVPPRTKLNFLSEDRC